MAKRNYKQSKNDFALQSLQEDHDFAQSKRQKVNLQNENLQLQRMNLRLQNYKIMLEIFAFKMQLELPHVFNPQFDYQSEIVICALNEADLGNSTIDVELP